MLVIGITLALFYLPDSELGTGFAGLDVQADSKYDDLFAAAEKEPIAELAQETEEPALEELQDPEDEYDSPVLRPQAVHLITKCTKASNIGGIAAGDILKVNVPTITANRSPCITMDVAGVSLNCSGNTIVGNGSFRGVDITANNVGINDCNFINFSGSSRFIKINGGSFVNISNCNFFNSSMPFGRGIETAFAPASSDVRIADCDFHNVQVGDIMNLPSVTNLDIIRNKFRGLYGAFGGISFLRTFNTNTLNMTGNFFNITMDIVTLNTGYINKNNWSDLDLYFVAGTMGLTITGGNTVQIQDNNPIPVGIDLLSPTSFTVQNNTFRNNGRIVMNGVSTANVFRNNRFDPTARDLVSSAGVFLIGPSRFTGNYIANGEMASIKVTGDNSNITDNQIVNVIGNAFVVSGDNNTFRNNTVYNFTGDAFQINGSGNIFLLNNITYFLTLRNTSFNPNVSTPEVPVQNSGFLLNDISNRTNITSNWIRGVNPSRLLNGLWGVRTNGYTDLTTIYNNTFSDLRAGVWMKDCSRPMIASNILRDNEQRGIIVQNCTGTSVTDNDISALGLIGSTNPYDRSAGLYVYRHSGGYFARNNVSEYNIGLYLNNASNNVFEHHNIQGPAFGGGIGIFSLYGSANNYSQFLIQNKEIGVKLLYSNGSNFTAVNTTPSVVYGYQLYKSHLNNIRNSQFGAGQTVSLEFSHFSSNNTANNNIFGGALDVDCLYDLFAQNNTGAGNGVPTQRQENGAAGNLIV